MSAIADGIDYIAEFVLHQRGDMTVAGCENQRGLNSALMMMSAAGFMLWLLVWTELGDQGFSCVLTAAAMVQCFGFLLLTLRVRTKKSVAGLSAKTLVMYVLHLVVRLSTTTLKRGYIPIDRSGMYFYQLMDISTLASAMHLTYCCHKTYRHTYQDDHDDLPLLPLIVPAFILAYFINSNLNRCFFFDYVWFASTNLETMMMVPQLWMLSKVGGKVSSISSQFVACNVLKNVLLVTFWLFAYTEVSKRNPADPTNMAGKQIIGCYFLQLFMSADFMFYYVKGFLEGKDHVILPHNAVEM